MRFPITNITRPPSAAVQESFHSDTSGPLSPEGFLSEESNQRERERRRMQTSGWSSDAIFGFQWDDGPGAANPHPWPTTAFQTDSPSKMKQHLQATRHLRKHANITEIKTHSSTEREGNKTTKLKGNRNSTESKKWCDDPVTVEEISDREVKK